MISQKAGSFLVEAARWWEKFMGQTWL